MQFFGQEYSKALGRTITYADMPVEAWRDGLLKRGLPAHLVNHLATMADLHRAGRYDRTSDDVLTLTGQSPMTVREFVRKHAATFSTSLMGPRKVDANVVGRKSGASGTPMPALRCAAEDQVGHG